MDHNQINDTQIYKILSLYDLGEITSYAPILIGGLNTSFKLNTSDGEFVFTICDNSNKEKISVLITLLNTLIDNKVSTSRIIKQKSGEDFSFYCNKPIYIKEYIKGSTLSYHSNEQIFQQLGLELAKIHNLPNDKFNCQNKHLSGAFLEEVEEHLPNCDFSKWYHQQKEKLLKEYPQNLPEGLVHADVFFDNIIIADNKFQAIIDFECASYYPYSFDIASALIGCVFDPENISFDRIHPLLSGYQSIRPLSDAELKSIKYFSSYIALSLTAWRYSQYEVKFPHSKNKKDFRELVKVYQYIKDMSLIDFLKKIEKET